MHLIITGKLNPKIKPSELAKSKTNAETSVTAKDLKSVLLNKAV